MMRGSVFRWILLPRLFLQPPEVRRLEWSSPSPEPLGTSSYLLVFHLSALLLHNHKDAVFVSLRRHPINFLLSAPVIPIALSALHIDCPTKLLHLTSTAKNQIFHPFCWQSFISSWYFRFFLSFASSILSSHGTVSSSSTAKHVKVQKWWRDLRFI